MVVAPNPIAGPIVANWMVVKMKEHHCTARPHRQLKQNFDAVFEIISK
jgi:hypothetical protein